MKGRKILHSQVYLKKGIGNVKIRFIVIKNESFSCIFHDVL
jgi:hypothetical protein